MSLTVTYLTGCYNLTRETCVTDGGADTSEIT